MKYYVLYSADLLASNWCAYYSPPKWALESIIFQVAFYNSRPCVEKQTQGRGFLLVFDLWKMSSVCKCVAVRPCSHLLFLGREKFVTAHLHRVIGVVFSQKNSFAHNRFIWAVNHLATSRDFIRLAALCRNISSEWSGRLNLELTGWCCTQSAAVPFIYGHINGGLRRDYRTRRVVSIELNRHFTNISSHLIDCSRRRCELNGCHHRRHQTAGNGSTFAYVAQ